MIRSIISLPLPSHAKPFASTLACPLFQTPITTVSPTSSKALLVSLYEASSITCFSSSVPDSLITHPLGSIHIIGLFAQKNKDL